MMEFIKVHLKIRKEKGKESLLGIMDNCLRGNGKTILNKVLENGLHRKEINTKAIGL
jgi:hypothetical protein